MESDQKIDVKEWLQSQLASLRDGEKVENVFTALAAMIPVASLFLPWLLIDDTDAPATGAQLSIYFLNGPDRDFFLEHARIEAWIFLASPVLIGIGAIYIAVKSVYGTRTPKAYVFMLVMSMAFVFSSRTLADSAHPDVYGIPIPDIGVWLIVGTNIILLGYIRNRQDSQDGNRFR